jgi:hypothetical protein
MPPLIAAGLVSVGVGSTVASIAGEVIFTGALVGLSLLLAPNTPKPEDGKVPVKQTIPSRDGVIGTVRRSGPYALFHNDHNGGTAVVIVLLCDCPPYGEINSFDRYYLHEDVVEIDVSGAVQRLDDKRYNDDRVHLFTRTGLRPETSYSDVNGDIADVWTVDHRLDGIGSICQRASAPGSDEQAEVFPLGLPLPSAVINCRKVFDPRDVTQVWNDRSTWKAAGNDNPVLAQVYFMSEAQVYGGGGLDFEECFLPVVDEIADAADVCDELVALKGGGTQSRYRSSGTWKYLTAPVDTMAAISAAGDTFMAERGDGAFSVRAGKWLTDDFDITIDDRHIIDLRIDRYREDENEVTGVIVQYNSPSHEYTTVDAPVWPRDAYQGGDDKRVRTTQIIWCIDGRQAQRLSKRVALYEMAPIRVSMVTTLWAIQLLDRRGFTLQTSDDPDLADVKCKIDRVTLQFETATVAIEATIIDPDAVDAWDAETEEGALQPFVTVPLGNEGTPPSNVHGVAELVGGNIRVILYFTVASDNADYSARYRQTDVGGGISGGWSPVIIFDHESIEFVGDQVYLTLNNFSEDEFEFQVRAHLQGASEWSAGVIVNTAAPSPGRPFDFEIMLVGSDVQATWTAPNSSNFANAVVYRALHGTDFELAENVSGDIPGSPLAPMSFTDSGTEAGTYDYWVVSKTAGGVASSPAGPQTIAVTGSLDVIGAGGGDVLGAGSGDVLGVG